MEGLGRLGDFDFIEYLKKPPTILRIVSLIFAIVVFGCIAAGGYDHNSQHCVFNKEIGACQYGIGIGVIAFLACLVFLAGDAHANSFSAASTRRIYFLSDLGFCGLWTFLWFVGFCYLADMWRRTEGETTQFETDHARAAIAFSFFSIFTWGGLTIMSFLRYRQGSSDFDYGGKDFPGEVNSPYASFPTPGGDPENQDYNPQPFGNQSDPDYNPPTY